MKKTKKMALALVIVVLALAAVIVAVVLSKKDKDDNSDDGAVTNVATQTEAEPAQPANVLVFKADQLTKRDWNNGTGTLENGKWNLTFPAQYDEVILNLPEEINLAKCEQVVFNFESQSMALSLKLRNGEEETSDTVYGQTGANEYTLQPTSEKTINAVGIMISEEPKEPATAELISVTFVMQEGYGGKLLGENIIENSYFAEGNLDAWTINAGESVITEETADAAIFDNIATYGKIDRDPAVAQTGDCFSQDITAKVSNGDEYQYEFYAMLSDDYKNAPEDQRTVDFAPYITVDGTTTYLGSYSSGIISGESSKVLTPGEWTKFSGSFNIAYSGNLDECVIRIIEQGTEYGAGDCVKGDYFVTGVTMRKVDRPKPEIQKDIPNWKDAITEGLGEDTIAGLSLMNSELSDEALMELVTKHGNAITLANELKPDATFGYSNDVCPGTEEATLNGEKITVPVLDHSLAEKMLDVILAWNNEHKDAPIKVRGHVLVWHSQTPEWFFHENYDTAKPLVSAEEMDKRQEWYIQAMLTHFVGEDSKYKDLFYGWDVVNEAVSDNSGTYRNSSEGSMWWKVYGDESFIINAFKYANKYAPAELELYYNDYNECVAKKQEGIVNLLTAVKAAEGEPGVGTRIDGMGMQGHHDMYSPTVSQIESAARAYAAVINNIQLTELDIKANGLYDGTSATREMVYNQMAYRYKEIFDTCIALKEDGVNVTGITIWGVIDTNSWLNDQANVGGGTDGTEAQCPLLFDGEYQAKPSFYGFVDPTKLEPATKKVTAIEYQDETFAGGNTYEASSDYASYSFIPMWTADGLKVKVNVIDVTEDASDAIEVYIDTENSKSEAFEPQKVVVKRSDAEATADGYCTVVEVPMELAAATTIGFDIRVMDGSTIISYNDLKDTQETSSKYYAEVLMKPYTVIHRGTITVDAELDEEWEKAQDIPLMIDIGGVEVSCNMRLLWDNQYLYVYADVKDPDLNKVNTEVHQQDSIEVFIDENNHKAEAYEEDDKQYRVNYKNERSYNGSKCVRDNIESAAAKNDEGYVVEAMFKWTDISPAVGTEIGLELQVNDANNTGVRIGTLSWFDTTGTGWTSPSAFGNAKLVD